MGDKILEGLMAKIPSKGLEDSLKQPSKDIEMLEADLSVVTIWRKVNGQDK